MKKYGSALLTFIIFLSIIFIVTVFAGADQNYKPLYSWNISESETDSVFAKLYPSSDSSGEYQLIINGAGNMRQFSPSSPAPWLEYSDSITSLTIENQVASLSRGVVAYCTHLEEIRIENPDILIPDDAIPYTTKIYGHKISTAQRFTESNFPDRFFVSCRFENSVCITCGYECLSHIGGEPDCDEFPKCEICKAEYGSKKEHVLSQLVSEQPASCTADGMSAHYYCIVCNQFFDESREPKAKEALLISASHSFGDFIPYVAPTCTEPGVMAHYHCETCGDDFDETKASLQTVFISATGHSGGNATCSQPAVCDVCNQPYGNLDSENHVYSEILKYDNECHWSECECSSKKNVSQHTLIENILKQSTESEEGIIEISCLCGYKTEKSIPVLEIPDIPENTDDDGNRTYGNIRYIIILICCTLVISAIVITILIFIKVGKNNV